MTGPEIEELVARAVRGEPESLCPLLEHFGPKIGRRMERKISTRWRASLEIEDVMQVTYLEAFLTIDRFRGRDAASFEAWARRIAENNLRDALKALGRRKRPPPERRLRAGNGEDSQVALLEAIGLTDTTPSRAAAIEEGIAFLGEALSELPADYRAAVEACDLQGLSAAELAQRMGRTVGAVHMLRARAHDRLRSIMGSASRFFSSS